MAPRTIIQARQAGGDEASEQILKAICEVVTTFDDELLDLISDLIDTIRYQPLCVGLAAPQIGVSRRVAVTQISEQEELVLINPEIVRSSGKRDAKRESCMSLWGLTGSVERREKILVTFTDIDGSVIERQFTGFPARIVAHEVDHLSGILFRERVSGGLSRTDLFDDYSPLAPK